VIVVSGQSADDQVFKALDLGAADFIAKPTPRAAPELATIQDELIRKAHAIRDLRIEKVRERAPALPPLPGAVRADPSPAVIAIGSSTGGPSALMRILGAFAEAPPCVVLVAQHMPAGFTAGFAERLDRLTPFRAREAQGGEELGPGEIWVAPGGRHLEVESVGTRILTRVQPHTGAEKYAPSADRLFASAAKHFGADLLGVVLTGMGDDGRAGARAIQQAGGSVIAESEETAVIFGMPRQVIQAGCADRVLPLPEIPRAIAAGAVGGERQGSGDTEKEAR
jgi:two-component system chemotaxis response regulator CheB